MDNKTMKKQYCPMCYAHVKYNFCSDRWECENCNYTDLYCPSESEEYRDKI